MEVEIGSRGYVMNEGKIAIGAKIRLFGKWGLVKQPTI